MPNLTPIAPSGSAHAGFLNLSHASMSVAPSVIEPPRFFFAPQILVDIQQIPNQPVQVLVHFPVMLLPEDGLYIATSPISPIYEAADNPRDALTTFLDALVEHMAWLTEEESTLAPHVAEELHLLRIYLRLQ